MMLSLLFWVDWFSRFFQCRFSDSWANVTSIFKQQNTERRRKENIWLSRETDDSSFSRNCRKYCIALLWPSQKKFKAVPALFQQKFPIAPRQRFIICTLVASTTQQGQDSAMSGIAKPRELVRHLAVVYDPSLSRAYEILRKGWKGTDHKPLLNNDGVHEPLGATASVMDRSCLRCVSLGPSSSPEATTFTKILGQQILLSFHNIIYLE